MQGEKLAVVSRLSAVDNTRRLVLLAVLPYVHDSPVCISEFRKAACLLVFISRYVFEHVFFLGGERPPSLTITETATETSQLERVDFAGEPLVHFEHHAVVEDQEVPCFDKVAI